MLQTFQKWTFCKGLKGENDGPSIGDNGARNIYSNYNQTRAYVECSPNQSKNYTLSTFPSSNRGNIENSGKVLAETVILPKYCSSALSVTLIRWLSLLYVYKWTTASVMRELLSISVRRQGDFEARFCQQSKIK